MRLRPLVRRLAVVLTASSLGCADPEPAPPVVAPALDPGRGRRQPEQESSGPTWRSPTRGGELAVTPPPAPAHLERVRLVPPLRAVEGPWSLELTFRNPGPPCPFEAEFLDERGARLGLARGQLLSTRAGHSVTLVAVGPDASAPVASLRVRPAGAEAGAQEVERVPVRPIAPLARSAAEPLRPVDVRLRAALRDVQVREPTELVQPGTTDERWRVELTYENGGPPSSALVRFLDGAGAPLEELTLTLPTTGVGTSFGQFVVGPDAAAPVGAVEVVPGP